jgi:hypothetical protein
MHGPLWAILIEKSLPFVRIRAAHPEERVGAYAPHGPSV